MGRRFEPRLEPRLDIIYTCTRSRETRKRNYSASRAPSEPSQPQGKPKRARKKKDENAFGTRQECRTPTPDARHDRLFSNACSSKRSHQREQREGSDSEGASPIHRRLVDPAADREPSTSGGRRLRCKTTMSAGVVGRPPEQ